MMILRSLPFETKKLPWLLGGLGLAGLPPMVSASDWIITPAVTVEQVYTDNALLTHDNEESESITRLRPSISLYREGGRASVDVNYAPEYRHYWQETEDNEVVHFLRADGKLEVAENVFFLDGWASADLTNITSRGRSGIDGLTGRSDTTEVYTLGISPYFTARMGNFSTFEARYTADAVDYSEDGVDDNRGQRVDLVLGSGTGFTNQVWELSAMQSVVDYDNLDEDNEAKVVRAEYIQQLTRVWALAFAAGYEDYKLAVSEDSDGSLWSVGIIYTPSPRTRLALGGGERAFGKDYYLDFLHRSQRTIWTASYRRDYTSARDEIVRPSLFQRQDAFGNLVRDPVLENPPVGERGGSPALSAEYYELERFETSFTLATGRTTLSLRGGRTDRNYENPVEDTRELDAAANISRNLSQRTTGFFGLSWRDHEEDLLNYDQWLASLGGDYRIGEISSLGLRLDHLERDADTDIDSYQENRFSLFYTAAF